MSNLRLTGINRLTNRARGDSRGETARRRAAIKSIVATNRLGHGGLVVRFRISQESLYVAFAARKAITEIGTTPAATGGILEFSHFCTSLVGGLYGPHKGFPCSRCENLSPFPPRSVTKGSRSSALSRDASSNVRSSV